MEQDKPAKKGGYGKRPLWQWILLYVIVAGILYFAVYYIFFANKTNGSYGSTGNTTTTSQTQSHSLY